MKKIKIFIIITVFVIVSTACQADKGSKNIGSKKTIQDSSEVTGDGISNVPYKKDGIEAGYPKLISGGSEEELKKWNQMIYEDFNKILDIYSFNPFPELTPVPTNLIPTILKIDYKVKLNNDKLISILYNAAYNSKYSAHPTDLVYTTNINKEKNERLKLPDIIKVNQAFVKDFRTWDFIFAEPDNEELNKAIKDYVSSLSDEDLLMGFQTADIIGSGNLWGIYSYLTPDRLGISLGVPNYIGDHVEFEREYSKIKDYLKLDIIK